ncbi:PREDICTED: uncharacterized protein LOC107341634 [Acropora digitifera]|uniref:uncharacterized protein LOC107341634 n=1 Tax=Acropora digitifera TaxID=70779 RepID=UPI00077AB850|nr:PREDICTED: uncharacterized protein LOC107341634 [Acropora digitifera]
MTKGLSLLIHVLLGTQILGVLLEGEAAKSSAHKRKTEYNYNDGNHIKRKSNTHGKIKEEHENGQVSKAYHKKDQKSFDLENVLFDPKELKKYVLGYLQSHGLARDSAMAEGTVSQDREKKPSRRYNEHGGKVLKDELKYNRQRKKEHKNHFEEHYSVSERKSKITNGKHSSRTKNDQAGVKDKATHIRRGDVGHTHSKQSSKGMDLELKKQLGHSSSKRNFAVEKGRRHHEPPYRSGNAFRVKEESASEGRRFKSHISYHSLYNPRRGFKAEGSGRTSKRAKVHTTSRHVIGHRNHERGFSKRKLSRHIFRNKDTASKSNLNKHKSTKRDFVAIRPPQAFHLEGFKVEKVNDNGKRKPTKGKKHHLAKQDKPRSRERGDESKTVRVEKSHDDTKEKSFHRRKTHTKLRKYSHHEEEAPKKKHIEKSSSLNNNSHHRKNNQRKASRRSEGKKNISVVRKSSGTRYRDEENGLKTKRQRKARRKSSIKALSIKRPSRKENHEKKNSVLHRHETSSERKRRNSLQRKKHKFKLSDSWMSLEKRKIPSWFDDAKFGIFVHWGVFSVPSFDNEWFWYNWKGIRRKKYVEFVKKNYPPGFSYSEFAPLFKAEFFNATQWAELVANSGARYFVFTSKHHEGFTNWNSSVAWNWNSVDTGPHKNIVDELAKAFRDNAKPQVKFGLYYSLYEWFNPHYLKDKANGFKTDEYVKAVMMPQLYDLVNTYKPEYLWTDGEWEAKDTYWKSKEFLSWLFNESPVKDTVVVNDRWGQGRCLNFGVCTGNDRYNPGKLK